MTSKEDRQRLFRLTLPASISILAVIGFLIIVVSIRGSQSYCQSQNFDSATETINSPQQASSNTKKISGSIEGLPESPQQVPDTTKAILDATEESPDKCIPLPIIGIKIPIDMVSGLIGSFAGAFYTFCAIYGLELIKEIQKPKPEIKIYFASEAQEEVFVECLGHCIYLKERNTNVNVGNAYYLRAKIKNEGDIVAKNCSVYLKSIEKRKGIGKQVIIFSLSLLIQNMLYRFGSLLLQDYQRKYCEERKHCKKNDNDWEALKSYRDSMPLMWAYERKEDCSITSRGIDIPSKAYSYVDILVFFQKDIKPGFINKETEESETQNNEESKIQGNWFVKLKTKSQPPKHANVFDINNTNYEYKLTLEAYADSCKFDSINIILHSIKIKGSENLFVEFYVTNNSDQKIQVHEEATVLQYSNKAKIEDGIMNEIYDFL